MSSNAVEGLLSVEFIYCACGCGFTRPKYDHKKRVRKFIDGHQNRNRIGPTGSNHPMWKGGETIGKYGYIWIKKSDYHGKTYHGYVMKHRLVYEEYYNCCLLPWIVVHHKNENKQDNRIENLEPLTNPVHSRLHTTKDKSNRFCSICGGKTYIRPNGYERWAKIDGNWLCHKCNNRIKNRERK